MLYGCCAVYRDDYDALGRRTTEYRTSDFKPPRLDLGGRGLGLGPGFALGGFGRYTLYSV